VKRRAKEGREGRSEGNGQIEVQNVRQMSYDHHAGCRPDIAHGHLSIVTAVKCYNSALCTRYTGCANKKQSLSKN